MFKIKKLSDNTSIDVKESLGALQFSEQKKSRRRKIKLHQNTLNQALQ